MKIQTNKSNKSSLSLSLYICIYVQEPMRKGSAWVQGIPEEEDEETDEEQEQEEEGVQESSHQDSDPIVEQFQVYMPILQFCLTLVSLFFLHLQRHISIFVFCHRGVTVEIIQLIISTGSRTKKYIYNFKVQLYSCALLNNCVF